ncbi:hypothetical protein JKP88DRAFT_249695 [Tribonema minus]|uniref:Uncharacterized protein n=1 Tax=Tribonema minus TaxID=303371 RepID=A0A836C9B3_9STRA|nr:hypothetical protein JKP88DRAFT_249695 [Tribonema minus]
MGFVTSGSCRLPCGRKSSCHKKYMHMTTEQQNVDERTRLLEQLEQVRTQLEQLRAENKRLQAKSIKDSTVQENVPYTSCFRHLIKTSLDTPSLVDMPEGVVIPDLKVADSMQLTGFLIRECWLPFRNYIMMERKHQRHTLGRPGPTTVLAVHETRCQWWLHSAYALTLSGNVALSCHSDWDARYVLDAVAPTGVGFTKARIVVVTSPNCEVSEVRSMTA